MLLRPRQKVFVDRCTQALDEHQNTVGIAPTGAGKTVMLSATMGQSIGGDERLLVLQHRDELVKQNRRTFRAVNTDIDTGVVDADHKNWNAQATFAMVQTLSRKKNLERMPRIDKIAIDETHHVAAESYLKIIRAAKAANEHLQVFGVTATPQRGDGKGLRAVFDNVADQVTIGELISSGHLVKPRTFVVDLGVREELQHVRRTAQDFDMTEVERILDHDILNDKVVEKWKELAGNRQTVIFCSTVQHCRHVMEAFRLAGVTCEMITGETSSSDRQKYQDWFEAGRIQILLNVAVLTEGWDCPPCSSVVLLRPSSYKSTMMQMIGRGLRTIDPEKYPGVVKNDCIIIDFGTSCLTHGSLEQTANIEGREKDPDAEAPKKNCPGCKADIPISLTECPFCGHEFRAEAIAQQREVLQDFALTEIDLFEESPFRWESLFDDQVLVATAFDAWAMCVMYKGQWYALGGCKEVGIKICAVADRLVCIAAADDFLRQYGDTKGAGKTKAWLHLPATAKQCEQLGIEPIKAMMYTRYRAACEITWKWNQHSVRKRLELQTCQAA